MIPLVRRSCPVLIACLLLWGDAAAALSLPAGEGLSVVRRECTRCHPLRKIVDAGGKTRAGWETHVIRMTDIERRPENMKAVVDYLSAHFPPE